MSAKKGNPAAQADAENAARNRREEARAKAQKMQAEAAAAERRKRVGLAAIAVVVVAALAIGITMLVRNASESAKGTDAAFGAKGIVTQPAPQGSKAAADDAVTVRVYSDYLCPACRTFEETADGWLTEQQKAGTIKREYVPIAILDHLSNGSKFPTRSAGAAYCVAEADPAKLAPFTKAMYAVQPAEGGGGMDQAQILTVAKEIVPSNPAMEACITDEKYNGYVGRVTDEASKDGMASTPTVMVNGKIIRPNQNESWLQGLQREVAAAAGGGAGASASATASQ